MFERRRRSNRRRNRPRRRRSERLVAYESVLPGLKARPNPPGPAIAQWIRGHVGTVVVLIVLSVIAYWFFASDTFYVYDADVRGTVYTTPEEIYALADIDGWNVFWIDAVEVEQRIESLAIVKDARVSLRLPNTVRIEVTERQPVAVWQSGPHSMLVDAEGVLFGLRGDASRAVSIHDLRDVEVAAGQEVDPQAVTTALALHRLLPERRAFDWRPAAGIGFVTEGGWTVRFGDHQRLQWKVAVFRAFEEQLAAEKSVTLLDLTAPDRPYYRVGEQ